MTVDERIEALTRRHEALTMNLELMGHQMEDQRNRIGSIGTHIDRILGIVEKISSAVESHERGLSDGGL